MGDYVTIATANGSSLNEVMLIFGILLMAGAVLAGLARRGFLSMVALYVVVGLLVGNSGFGWIHFNPRSPFVQDLSIVALVVILFRDGLEVDSGLLRRDWTLPARKLLLAMPITATIIAVSAHYAADLGWTWAFLLGSLLAPTDPVLSSSVVTNPRVPAVIRNSLNLESGMNDGLALPAVLAFVAVLDHQGDFVLWQFLLRDVGGGLIVGLVLAAAAGRIAPRGLDDLQAHLVSLYALGAALLTYGVATLTINANGLIAVFTGAIALGAMREDIQETFAKRADDIIELVKLAIFVVFGATVTLSAIFDWGWAAWAVLAVTFFVARPVGIGISLTGTDLSFRAKAFMAWFGPKGVATMSFSLFVLGHLANSQEVVDIASLCVLFSIIAHGLTDVPGANWIAKHSSNTAGEPPPGQTAA